MGGMNESQGATWTMGEDRHGHGHGWCGPDEGSEGRHGERRLGPLHMSVLGHASRCGVEGANGTCVHG